jgi:hypothetical protein
MTFEDWFYFNFGVKPNLDPKDYDNDLKFKSAYEAGYRQRNEEIMDFYREVVGHAV